MGFKDETKQSYMKGVSLAKQYNPEDLDLLNGATLDVLEKVWNQCGRMTQKDIVEYTHKFPEWENPHGSSKEIEYESLLVALGYGEESKNMAEELEAQREASKLFPA